MNTATSQAAHPSLVEIIKQPSSDEAKILKRFAEDHAAPIINLRLEAKKPYSGGSWVIKDFTTLPYETGCVAPYLGNLERLGLIKLDAN